MIFAAIESADDSLKVERLYYQYRKLMYREEYEILKDKHFAEDAVDESFIRIINNLHKIEENNICRTRSFLVIICRNVAKDMYRSRIYLNTGDNLSDEVTNEDTGIHSDPSDIIINKDTVKMVEKAIMNLDPIYRDVFLLKRVHGLSREEIAKIFGISVETVKKRLLRAKIKIISSLEKEEIR